MLLLKTVSIQTLVEKNISKQKAKQSSAGSSESTLFARLVSLTASSHCRRLERYSRDWATYQARSIDAFTQRVNFVSLKEYPSKQKEVGKCYNKAPSLSSHWNVPPLSSLRGIRSICRNKKDSRVEGKQADRPFLALAGCGEATYEWSYDKHQLQFSDICSDDL